MSVIDFIWARAVLIGHQEQISTPARKLIDNPESMMPIKVHGRVSAVTVERDEPDPYSLVLLDQTFSPLKDVRTQVRIPEAGVHAQAAYQQAWRRRFTDFGISEQLLVSLNLVRQDRDVSCQDIICVEKISAVVGAILFVEGVVLQEVGNACLP